MPWMPTEPGERPTLGWLAIEWMREYLLAPDDPTGSTFAPYREQEDFLLAWYEIDPETGTFVYQRGVLGRPRGWGKSPFVAAIALFEAIGPCLPDGWDADGQPVGLPWSEITKPWVQIAAVSEDQTRNTWEPLLDMVGEDSPIHDDYDVAPLEGFVALPKRGRIEPITSSARTVKGARSKFVVMDQTEEWIPSNGGTNLARKMRSNAAKVGGRILETPNAFIPGELSVAEGSAAYLDLLRQGKIPTIEGGGRLLYDHREANESTDMWEHDSLIEGLRYAYGDSSGHPDGCVIHDPPCAPGHVNLTSLATTIWDSGTDAQEARSDFLNQIGSAGDAWLTKQQWDDIEMDEDTPPLMPGDRITLGFDGSHGRKRGNPDATALVGCRIRDGLLFEVKIWEPPMNKRLSKDWTPPVMEIDQTVDWAFQQYRVMGFYADPSGWATNVAGWEAKYRRRLRLKASGQGPIQAWPRGKDVRVEEYTKRLHEAIFEKEIRHNGSAVLGAHMLNARRRASKTGYRLYKQYPESPNKIDGAYAAVMAFKARNDAISRRMSDDRESWRTDEEPQRQKRRSFL